MLAFHNDNNLKDQTLILVQAHADADRLVQGTYWNGSAGCAVGCTIESLRQISGKDIPHDRHAAYEELIGVPRLLARLEDGIFEGLPYERAMTRPMEFLSAIRPGADLSRIWPQFAIWLLDDVECGVIRFARTDTQRERIRVVADLYRRQLEGIEVSQGEWRADAAYASASAAADAYAKQQIRIQQADKLLELLKAA